MEKLETQQQIMKKSKTLWDSYVKVLDLIINKNLFLLFNNKYDLAGSRSHLKICIELQVRSITIKISNRLMQRNRLLQRIIKSLPLIIFTYLWLVLLYGVTITLSGIQ